MLFGTDAGVDLHDSSDDIESALHEMMTAALIFAAIADIVLNFGV